MRSASSGMMPPVSMMRAARPAPFDLAVDAIAGDARFVTDDGPPRAGKAVEERGLADVGAAADDKDGQVSRGAA